MSVILAYSWSSWFLHWGLLVSLVLLVAFILRRADMERRKYWQSRSQVASVPSALSLSVPQELAAIPEDVREPTNGPPHLNNGGIINTCTYNGGCIYQKKIPLRLPEHDG